jgi:hypothetical protein
VTYLSRAGQREFTALLLYSGKDNYAHLSAIPLLTFGGDSRAYNSVWPLLQSLIDRPPAGKLVLLNGDWAFLNSLLGIGSPASTYPCPVCLVKRGELLTVAPVAARTPELMQQHAALFATLTQRQQEQRSTWCEYSSMHHQPLLLISPLSIVPLPLHLLLGICNHVIRKVYPLLLPEAVLSATIASVKDFSVTTPGAAAVFDMNGKETAKWVERSG